MTLTKELRWKDLTAEEQKVAVSCGRLANPKDFNYHRVAGELYASSEEHAWIATVPWEFNEEYEEAFEFLEEDEEAYISGACLIPITTDKELSEEEACVKYLGVNPKHVSDFTIGV